MTTLVEFMIIAGANNRPPMLEKSMYDSWKIHVELYIENRENERMILNSVQNGPLVWPTVAQEDGDDPIAYLDKAMAFLLSVAALRFPLTNNQLRTSSNPRNQATIQDGRVTMQKFKGGKDKVMLDKAILGEAHEFGQMLDEEQLAFLADPGILYGQAAQTTIPNNVAFHTEDLDAYDFDCDDVLMQRRVISSQHAFIPVIDDEEILILEEVSRSKMLAKQKDPISKEKKINTTPINYVELNRLSGDFGKRFVPQQELSAEQAFWLQTSHPNTSQSDISPVNSEAPRALPKDVMLCVMNSTVVFGDSENLKMQSSESCDKFCNLDAELLKTQNAYNELSKRRLKGKIVLDNATTIAPGLLKLDLDHLAPRLLKSRNTHIDYIKYTQEQAHILQGIVKQAKAKYPLDNALDFACRFIQTPDSKTPVLPSTGLKSSTSASRSQPTCNKKNDRITQTPSSNMKNKLEAQLRRANLSSNKKNRVKDPVCDANVKHTMLNANSELICVKCKQCMFDANHDVYFLDFVNDVNVHSKSKSAKQSKQHNIWKPTGQMFTEIGYKWKPLGKLFTLVGNSCPLTSMIPKQVKSVGSSKISKIIESRIANNSDPNHSWGSNVTHVPSSSSLVNDRFRNDQIAKILGYGDY
nr:hypothetical protein [Tanacetum cinerariifolium]